MKNKSRERTVPTTIIFICFFVFIQCSSFAQTVSAPQIATERQIEADQPILTRNLLGEITATYLYTNSSDTRRNWNPACSGQPCGGQGSSSAGTMGTWSKPPSIKGGASERPNL